jgi:hypothetical protein
VRSRGTAASALVVALLVLAISGCGSSKKSASTQTTGTATHPVASSPSPAPASALDADFIAKANAVCARAKQALDARGQFPYRSFDPLHPDVKLLPKVGAFFAARRSIGDRVPGELQALGAPRKAASQWEQIVALSRQDRAIADRQIKAAEASDASAFVATVNAVAATDNRLGQIATSSGFSRSSPCGAIL